MSTPTKQRSSLTLRGTAARAATRASRSASISSSTLSIADAPVRSTSRSLSVVPRSMPSAAATAAAPLRRWQRAVRLTVQLTPRADSVAVLVCEWALARHAMRARLTAWRDGSAAWRAAHLADWPTRALACDALVTHVFSADDSSVRACLPWNMWFCAPIAIDAAHWTALKALAVRLFFAHNAGEAPPAMQVAARALQLLCASIPYADDARDACLPAHVLGVGDCEDFVTMVTGVARYVREHHERDATWHPAALTMYAHAGAHAAGHVAAALVERDTGALAIVDGVVGMDPSGGACGRGLARRVASRASAADTAAYMRAFPLGARWPGYAYTAAVQRFETLAVLPPRDEWDKGYPPRLVNLRNTDPSHWPDTFRVEDIDSDAVRAMPMDDAEGAALLAEGDVLWRAHLPTDAQRITLAPLVAAADTLATTLATPPDDVWVTCRARPGVADRTFAEPATLAYTRIRIPLAVFDNTEHALHLAVMFAAATTTSCRTSPPTTASAGTAFFKKEARAAKAALKRDENVVKKEARKLGTAVRSEEKKIAKAVRAETSALRKKARNAERKALKEAARGVNKAANAAARVERESNKVVALAESAKSTSARVRNTPERKKSATTRVFGTPVVVHHMKQPAHRAPAVTAITLHAPFADLTL